MIWRVKGFVGGVLLVLVASWCRADIPTEVVIRAKQATALAEVQEKDGVAEGSAFCIDATGLFVTNAHVVEALDIGGKLTLMLRSGEKDQTKVTVHVLALDKEADLAILQTDGPLKLTPLTLGSSDGLIETTSVVAFGYPFGTELALKEGDYPSITVSTGHITALRKVKGDLQTIQLDASLNPGNSGGPVLNDKGEVIAIVKEGIPGSGINNAIPVNYLRTLLARARLVFTPPLSPKEHLREAQEFRIQLLTPPQGAGEITVDLTLSADAKDHRTFRAVASPNGRLFTVHTPLLPSPKGPAGLQVTIQSRNNRIVGTVADQTIRVGGVLVPLSSISRIENVPAPHVTLSDERVLKGIITGVSSMDVDLDGVQTILNFRQFDLILVSPPTLPASVAYHITAKQDGKIFGDQEGTISLNTRIAPPEQSAAVVSSRSVGRNLSGYELVVSCLDSNDIRRFDARTGAYLGDFAVGNGLRGPQDMLWGPDGNLYVSCASSSSVRRFNGKTGQFIDAFVPDGSGGLNDAHGMAWGPDGNLYVASHWTKEVKRYNGKTGDFMDNFVRKGSGGLDRPTGVRFGPDGMLYVASLATNLIKRYNPQTGAYFDDFAGGSGLRGPGTIEFGPDGMLYVCSMDSSEVKRYNGQTGGFVDTFIPAKSGGLDCPFGLLFAPDGALYVSSKANVIKRYDAKTGVFLDNFIGGNNMVYPEHMLYRRKTGLQ